MDHSTPRKVEHQQTDRGYVPVYATGVVEQPWANYSQTDHEVWNTLYRRQRERLRHHYAYWRATWGWDPLNPDMEAIARRWGGTEVCWR